MSRSWPAWAIFAGCLALGLAALGTLSAMALRLDRVESEARHQAEREELVRLALWRMDSYVAHLIAQESARPYFTYKPFYSADQAYTNMFAPIKKGMVLCASPLLTGGSPFVRLYFQVDPDGSLSSPQAPTGNMRDTAEPALVSHDFVEACCEQLGTISGDLKRDELRAKLPEPLAPGRPERVLAQQNLDARGLGAAQDLDNIQQQRMKNLKEYEVRAQVANSAYNGMILQQKVSEPPPSVREGALTPLWMHTRLLLARRVEVNGKEYIQGCWIDWDSLREKLIGLVADLGGGTDLVPIRDRDDQEIGRRLAALPVRMIAPDFPPGEDPVLSPIKTALLIAWGCAGLAGIAVAALLGGALALSERRGIFVSAVTHELRTPLTTFRLYTEMLADGMVADEPRRQGYYRTLKGEADRLSHLVENVLSYARLERGRDRGRAEDVPLGELLARIKGRIAQHASCGGMSVVASADPELQSLIVRTDPSAIEQVLFNLIDNACKYACDSPNKRIEIEVEQSGSRAILRVRDYGPGICREQRRRLFRPFSKSAKDAAQSKAGVGLGLALSRKIARGLGGDLALEHADGSGALFALSIPIAEQSR